MVAILLKGDVGGLFEENRDKDGSVCQRAVAQRVCIKYWVVSVCKMSSTKNYWIYSGQSTPRENIFTISLHKGISYCLMNLEHLADNLKLPTCHYDGA